MSKYDELKHRVYECNMALPKHGIVIHTFGNASGIDREQGLIAIKPSGVLYEVLKPEDIVIVDLDGRVVEGTLKPSSDTKTHLVLYKAFPKIGGVVHTHSTYAVAWAQAAKPIPVLGTTHADHTHLDIPCTAFMADDKIQNDYELETGNQIVTTFANISYEEVEMVLVAGHGPFTWGKTPEKAVYNSVILEELAKMALLTLQINPKTPRLKEALIRKHYQRKHGPGAYYGQGQNH
ncbi:MAG: L-ribulose-5-phosphate 4-epimerase [candidate division KSB1 bacterium]|nr:L-ribulose-5-phosphate 4-epimerase [candidate division KSB1 bacterium]MDZ7302386.1 L-ribulose-5-phosphate 4-epimerase [candidate division KSB1 bacterium]MDZ7311589.1 L-ribulose-5-phosphate 4-epimerase [candidate division KSB1 bacterium]